MCKEKPVSLDLETIQEALGKTRAGGLVYGGRLTMTDEIEVFLAIALAVARHNKVRHARLRRAVLHLLTKDVTYESDVTRTAWQVLQLLYSQNTREFQDESLSHQEELKYGAFSPFY
jgi:hypothetical protein